MVTGEQGVLRCMVKPEGRISTDPRQFGQAVCIRKALPGSVFELYPQCLGVRVGEVQHVNDNVGIEDKAHMN